MANIAEVRIPILLDKERFMLFDGNGMCAGARRFYVF